jgi:hypothetical protein
MMREDNTTNNSAYRTTISISRATKARLDIWRPAGQCYDDFVIQIISLWEKRNSYSETAAANPPQPSTP